MSLIYKIVPKALWAEAEAGGTFLGAPIDHEDGYMHFSTADQVAETAALYFKGMDDLLLIAVDDGAFGDAVKYEASRGGDLFPHLYRTLPLDKVTWVKPMPLDENGNHILPGMD